MSTTGVIHDCFLVYFSTLISCSVYFFFQLLSNSRMTGQSLDTSSLLDCVPAIPYHHNVLFPSISKCQSKHHSLRKTDLSLLFFLMLLWHLCTSCLHYCSHGIALQLRMCLFQAVDSLRAGTRPLHLGIITAWYSA